MNYALAPCCIGIRSVEFRCRLKFTEEIGESFIEPAKIARLNSFRQTANHRTARFQSCFRFHSDQPARANATTLSPAIRPLTIETT